MSVSTLGTAVLLQAQEYRTQSTSAQLEFARVMEHNGSEQLRFLVTNRLTFLYNSSISVSGSDGWPNQ